MPKTLDDVASAHGAARRELAAAATKERIARFELANLLVMEQPGLVAESLPLATIHRILTIIHRHGY